MKSVNRDKAEICVDEHLQRVLTFMQGNVQTAKLAGIAKAMPAMADLLWAQYSPEPFPALVLKSHNPVASMRDAKPLVAIESGQAQLGVDGDSATAGCDAPQ